MIKVVRTEKTRKNVETKSRYSESLKVLTYALVWIKDLK